MLLRAWVCENRARFSELFLMLDAIEESLASAVAAGAPVDPQVRGEVLALRSFQRVLESRPAASAECAARALELLPKACVSERGYAYIVLSGALQMTGAASRARDVLYEALAAMGDSQGTAYQSRIVAGLGYVAWMEADGDRLGQAGRLCVELGERHELPESQLYGRYMLSLSQYQADDLESAEATLSGLAAPELMENAGGYAAATLVSAATHQASGRWDAAVGVVDELVEHLLRRGDTPVLRWVESYRALLLARQGNVRAALAWLRGEPGVDRLPPYLCHSAMLVAPRILLEDGTEASLEAAAEHLDDVVPYLKELHNARFLAEALGLEAWLRLARGDHRGARRALEDAVRLVLPGGLVRVLADVGPALHPLLEDLKGKGELRVFVDRVLSAGRRGRPAGREESGEELVLPLPRPLTKRETEVLSLMAQDLGNRDIARRLYISPATVKRHSENLYAKLGATGRREAVALARRRGLLRTSTGAN
jgi:LuxR family maltose regulon positive regulatory protein